MSLFFKNDAADEDGDISSDLRLFSLLQSLSSLDGESQVWTRRVKAKKTNKCVVIIQWSILYLLGFRICRNTLVLIRAGSKER